MFLAAIESLPGFHGTPDQLTGWLFRIARHDLADWRRYRRTRATTGSLDQHVETVGDDHPTLADPSARDVGEQAIGAVETGRLFALLALLTVEQRDALALRLAAGMTTSEIGVLLDRSPGAVKQLQRRGLQRLRQLVRSPSGLAAYPPDRPERLPE